MVFSVLISTASNRFCMKRALLLNLLFAKTACKNLAQHGKIILPGHITPAEGIKLLATLCETK